MLRQPAPAAISEPAPILIGPVVPVAIIKVERRSARLPAIRFGSRHTDRAHTTVPNLVPAHGCAEMAPTGPHPVSLHSSH